MSLFIVTTNNSFQSASIYSNNNSTIASHVR